MATQEYYIRNENETEARGPFNLEQLSRSVESVLTGNGAQKKGNGGTGLARGIRA